MATTYRPFGYHEALVRPEGLPILGDQLLEPISLTREPVYPETEIGRNIFRLTPQESASPFNEDFLVEDPFDGHEDLLYCHVPTLLRFSQGGISAAPNFGGGSPSSGDTVGGGNLGAIAYQASAAILMAFHDANTGNGTVAPELAGLHQRCPLRFTTEILDQGGSGLDAVKALTGIVSRPTTGEEDSSSWSPQPCALIGAHVSSATEKLASLAAVFGLPVVSPAAMSTTLNDPEQYPTFARTHTDVAGFGSTIVSFLDKEFGIKKIGMLFPNDVHGLGYANSVLEASAQYGIEVVGGGVAYQVSPNGAVLDEEDLLGALQALADTGCNYFVGSFYAGNLAYVMGLAAEYGIAGPGKAWFISGTADIAPFVMSGAMKLPKESSAVAALQGSGIYFCKGGIPGQGGPYDTFTQKWKETGADPAALAYINGRMPLKGDDGVERYSFPPGLFQKPPHHVVTYSYDAAVGVALSACHAWEQKHSSTISAGVDNLFRPENDAGLAEDDGDLLFSGAEHHALLSKSVYYGASGKVEFRQNFPTRTPESSYFVVVNLRATEHNASHVKFEGSPPVSFFNTSASAWAGPGKKQFVFSDGTQIPPPEMVPRSEPISTARTVSIALGAFVVAAAAVLLCCWRQNRRKMDAVWIVKEDDLHYGESPQVIGRGSFGVVLLAEYRGTKVAVKKALSTSNKKSKTTLKTVDGELSKLSSSGSSTSVVQLSSERNDAIQICMEEGNENINPGLKTGFTRQNTTEDSKLSLLKSSSSSSTEDPSHQRRRFKSNFVAEMRHLAKLRHPNITTTMGAVFPRVGKPMMIMEYMENGSLYDAIRNETINLNSSDEILTIIQDIAHGLRFLHAAKPEVIHGDLKSKNVLIDANYRAKIADFGLSGKSGAGSRGTPYWMAPELLLGKSSNSTSSDIYAFGILLYEVYSRENPYKGEVYSEVITQVCDPAICKRPPVPSLCPSKIASLMQRCWANEPKDRPSSKEVDLSLQAEGTIQGRVLRIAALNKELLAANHQISSEQAKQLEHFACMSHEIRTPLNCVIGISSLLEEDHKLDAMQQDSVKMIVSSGKLLRQVVDDVLDFSKFVSGNAEIDIKRTNLQDTLDTIISSMALFPATEKNQITVRTFYSPLVPQHIETDGRRMQQILYNLLSNAIKFSKTKGKVDLSVSVGSRYEVTPSGEKESKDDTRIFAQGTRAALRFRIKDYGQGIDKSEFGKLFEPFQQTESGRHRGKGGTGLGLPIVKQLVELLGGSISFDSELGEGTEFSLQFPLNTPLPDTREILSRLKDSCLWMVSDKEDETDYMDSVLEHYSIEKPHHFRSLEAILQQDSSGSLSSKRENKSSGIYRLNMLGDLEGYSSSGRKLGARGTENGNGQTNSSNKATRIICLVQDDLYNEIVFDRISNVSKSEIVLVTFGNKGKTERSAAHYACLTRVFPSVLMEQFGSLSKSSSAIAHGGMLNKQRESSLDEADRYKDLKILVAEDNVVNQKVITRLLERLGAQYIDIAEDGKIAVNLASTGAYDLIFMDMQMPVMDGIEACKHIMKARTLQPLQKSPKVVFLSANVLNDYESLLSETGATDYLTKPCALTDLRAMMEKICVKGE